MKTIGGTTVWGSAAAYAVTGLVAVAAAGALLWPWLGEQGRTGLVVAGVVAWGVQVPAFAALVATRSRTKRFLAAWGAGTVVRMAVILLAALAVVRMPALPPMPTLLALAGFLFGLLLLEPVFFRKALHGTNRDGRNRARSR